jgi:hypothetical protein
MFNTVTFTISLATVPMFHQRESFRPWSCQRHIGYSFLTDWQRRISVRPAANHAQSTHVHVVEPFVDLLEITVVSDKLVDPELSVHVICRGTSEAVVSKHVYAHCCKSTLVNVPPTMPGNSVRPLTPPKADPRQTRPVTCE